jgi:hypothetical protein
MEDVVTMVAMWGTAALAGFGFASDVIEPFVERIKASRGCRKVIAETRAAQRRERAEADKKIGLGALWAFIGCLPH